MSVNRSKTLKNCVNLSRVNRSHFQISDKTLIYTQSQMREINTSSSKSRFCGIFFAINKTDSDQAS